MSIEFNDAVSFLEDRTIGGAYTDDQMTVVEEKAAMVGKTVFERNFRNSEPSLVSRDFCSLKTNTPKMPDFSSVTDPKDRTALIGVLQLFLDREQFYEENVLSGGPLHDAKTIESLMVNGFDLNTPNNCGEPLMLTAMRLGHIKTVQLLLNAGADTSPVNDQGRSVIHYALDREIAELLLEAGADPYILVDNGDTLLHLHVECPQMVELWLRTGLNPNAKNAAGTTPLDIALGKNCAWSVELLLAGEATLSEERLARELQRAKEECNDNMLRVLLAFEQDQKGLANTAEKEAIALLNAAISSRKPEVVRQLLESGIDPNSDTFLSRSFWFRSCEETALLLIEAGANPNALNKNGVLPFYEALFYGFNEAAALLLKLGTDLNQIKLPFGTTPLALAITMGAMEIVDLLLDLGTDIDPPKNTLAQSPLTMMLNMCDMEDLSNIARFYRLLALGADPNRRDLMGDTPLTDAIEYGLRRTVLLLLEAGADPCVANRNGNTPLTLAKESGDKHIIWMIERALSKKLRKPVF